jgi:hypothetical protein
MTAPQQHCNGRIDYRNLPLNFDCLMIAYRSTVIATNGEIDQITPKLSYDYFR